MLLSNPPSKFKFKFRWVGTSHRFPEKLEKSGQGKKKKRTKEIPGQHSRAFLNVNMDLA
jgi:hypothetical protein